MNNGDQSIMDVNTRAEEQRLHEPERIRNLMEPPTTPELIIGQVNTMFREVVDYIETMPHTGVAILDYTITSTQAAAYGALIAFNKRSLETIEELKAIYATTGEDDEG